MASGTTKVRAAKCSKGCWESETKEMVFLCQMVGGIETEMCVPTGDVTPSVNKGCSPFWLTV